MKRLLNTLFVMFFTLHAIAASSEFPLVLQKSLCNPSENGYLEKIESITLEFDLCNVYANYPDILPADFTILAAMSDTKPLIITEVNSGDVICKLVHKITLNSQEAQDGYGKNTLNFKLDTPIELKKGYQYTLSIPDNVFYARARSLNTNNTMLPATTYTFYGPKEETPEALVKDLNPTTITPGYLEEVKDLSKFEFAFDQDIYLKENYGEVVISDMSGDNTYNCTLSVSADKRTLTCTPERVVTVEGTYHVVILSGTIGDEEWYNSGYTKGHTNDDIFPVAIVKGEEQPLKYDLNPLSVTPDPASTDLAEISVIELNFEITALKYEWGQSIVNLTDAEGNVIKNNYTVYNEAGRTGAFLKIIPKTPITTPGVYTLTIPASQFGDEKWLDTGHQEGRTNPEIVYTWTVVQTDFEVTNCSIKEGEQLPAVGIVTMVSAAKKAEATEGGVVELLKGEEVVKTATPVVYTSDNSSVIVADFDSFATEQETQYTLRLPAGAVAHVLPYTVNFSGIIPEKTEYVNVAYGVKTVVGEEISASSSDVKVIKVEAYSFKVEKAESEDWAVAVEGATLDETTGLYSTGALTDDANVVVTYTYTAPEIVIPEYVGVTYNVGTKVGDAETSVSGSTALVEKGKAFTADINVLDENWTAEVTGATLAEGKVATEALNEDATVEVVYVYNGKIVVIDDETTGAEGVEVDGLKVESVGGKIIVSGLNSGEMAMLYGMNAALLANGTAVYNTVEFEAPAGVAYIVSVVHNGNKLGFKILNK